MAGCGKCPRRVGQGLRVELAHPPSRLPPNRVEERRRGMAGRGKCPRRVRQLLRLEVAYPPGSLLPNRVEEHRRGMAGCGKCPCRVRQLLRLEVAHPSCRLLRNCVQKGMSRTASRGKRPRQVGQVLRLELAPTRQRRPLDLLPETPPRRAPEVQLRNGMRRIRKFTGAQCPHLICRLLSQGSERCAVVVAEPATILTSHSSQPAPASGEMDKIEGLAILRMQAQQLPRARRPADE